MWVWILVIIIAFAVLLCFTRWIGANSNEEGNSFINGLKKIKDACCGGRHEDEY